jgi:3-oxoadipate enol-lactonase
MTTLETFEAAGPAGELAGIAAGPTGGVALPVVLVHGINMSRDVWADVLEPLARSRRVVAFDLRGHGASHRSGPFTAEDYAADTLAVIDRLGIERAHVVGTSFGGSVACALAVRAPARVASIAAIGSALCVEGIDVDGAVAAIRAAGVRTFFAGFMPQASFAPGTDPKLIERELDAAANGRDVETVVGVSVTALGSDLRQIGAAVRVPALVVTGELDATCPVAAGEEMARTLRTELVVVPGRGHVLTMEDPAAVVRLIEGHLRKHEIPS